jgi:hypothetical protein
MRTRGQEIPDLRPLASDVRLDLFLVVLVPWDANLTTNLAGGKDRVVDVQADHRPPVAVYTR